LAIVTMKELLEAGVHFGHQTRRWDPRMKPYIFTERNGIHIIDLQKTIAQLKIAYNAIKELAKSNGTILFVGTKRQAQSAIVEEATRCGMPYVSNRWLGGMLTNFFTIQKSIQRLKKLERMEVDGSFEFMTKKEAIGLTREKEKLLKNIGGIKDLESLPDMIFIIDPKKEAIAVAEAMRLKIPIVSIIDTNCNPDGIDYTIPGNDDAIRAINLFTAIISSAVIEGQNEAGKIEITAETQIISLEEEERARAEKEKTEEAEGYLADEGLGDGQEPITEPVAEEIASVSSLDETTNQEEDVGETEASADVREESLNEGLEEEVTESDEKSEIPSEGVEEPTPSDESDELSEGDTAASPSSRVRVGGEEDQEDEEDKEDEETGEKP
jgi:small subunit ribosomal protein S2